MRVILSLQMNCKTLQTILQTSRIKLKKKVDPESVRKRHLCRNISPLPIKDFKMIGFLVNLFFAWFCWRLGSAHLDEGSKFIGWLGIVLSACNFAVAMAMIF